MSIRMWNQVLGCALVAAATVTGTAQAADRTAPELRLALAGACTDTAHPPAPDRECQVSALGRSHVSGDVFQYAYALKVGPGDYDVITLHRVVRERARGVPSRTSRGLFMVHGDLWGFKAAFLSSPASAHVPARQSIAVFLASRGVDVWGIDLRWVNAPEGVADYSFMKAWSIGTHLRDLRVGLAAARLTRGLTGSGFDQMAMLGWSSGGMLAYAYAADETRYPAALRHVDALIPVDIALKFSADHETQRLAACQRYEGFKGALDSGLYHNSGEAVRAFGLLAATEPEEPSPFIPGLTNRQGALVVGAATTSGSPLPPVPDYHFTAGVFDATGVPASLQYTSEGYLFEFFQRAAAAQSFTEFVEREALLCDEIDLPYDDHLSRVRIPVLYVGAEGGFGSYGLDTLDHLASVDRQHLIVQLHGADQRAIEFGHVDLFLAENARRLVWAPIYRWLLEH